MGLGFRTSATADAPTSIEIDVIREGRYSLYPLDGRTSFDHLTIDGIEVRTPTVVLSEGVHRVDIRADSPAYAISLSPRTVFGNVGEGRIHAPLFEYRRELRR